MPSFVVTGEVGVKRTPFKGGLACQLAVSGPDGFFFGSVNGVLIKKHHIAETFQKFVNGIDDAASAAVENERISVNTLNQPLFGIKFAESIILFCKRGITDINDFSGSFSPFFGNSNI